MNRSAEEINANHENLKRKFFHADQMLLEALNGFGRPVGTASEIAELRRTLLHVRAECDARGVEVETTYEFSRREHAETESAVRKFAEGQENRRPILSYANRQWLACAIGVTVVLCLASITSTFLGFAGAMFGGLVAFAIIESLLADLLPTPASRIGRLARARHVDVSDLWPENSDEHRDYKNAFRRQGYRMPKDVWMKAH